jgi:hypothetical protein
MARVSVIRLPSLLPNVPELVLFLPLGESTLERTGLEFRPIGGGPVAASRTGRYARHRFKDVWAPPLKVRPAGSDAPP